ncbi:hypothetical protein A2U01_0095361, partial [Trifolium medium]|nr:hypothetical protein [Trifolium medium]
MAPGEKVRYEEKLK